MVYHKQEQVHKKMATCLRDFQKLRTTKVWVAKNCHIRPENAKNVAIEG